MRTICLIGLLLTVMPLTVKAQYILQIKNRKTGKVYERYYPGQTIMFNMYDYPDKITGIIDSVARDTFFIGNIPYSLSSVDKVILEPQNCNWRVNGAKLMIAGAAYPGIEAFNSLNTYDRITVSRSTIIVSAALLATGYILYRIGKRSFKMGEKYYLRTI
jgi:hypothetical protein